MADREEAPRVSPVGYAVGTGGAVMALVAPFLHFAYPNVSDLWHFGGTFVAGAVVGAIVATVRTVRLPG